MQLPDNKPQETDLERWRMILGGGEADGINIHLSEEMEKIDVALGVLYDFERNRTFDYGETKGAGGSGKSNPGIARWLGDIRKYFPQSVVNVMQNDALKQPELKQKMMFEPEILEQAEADVHLVATLMELGKLIPSKTKDTARRVIRKVVDDLMQKLEQRTVSTLAGALDKSARNMNPRYSEINWNATIKRNLKNYLPEYKTIIPETRIGYGHKSKRSLKDIVLCLDQSGSMGSSVVYSGIFGAVMSSLPHVKTKMIVFDTEVADLSEDLSDPVELLFGVQLGGGTDINNALKYCQGIITRPDDTIFVLITDLYEGGNAEEMHRRVTEMLDAGVQVICLLALNDDGSPGYDATHAKRFSQNNIPVFACTPDMFPDLMAAAIKKEDLKQWAGDNDIVLK